MIEPKLSHAPVAGRESVSFAANWLRGSGGRGARRRLFAVLRMAHRSLGMSRRKLGLGALGAGRIAAFLVSLGIASAPATIALAQYAAGNATTTGEGTGSVAISGAGGGAASAAPANSVAIGTNAVAFGTQNETAYGVAIGFGATAGGAAGSVAIGLNAKSVTLGDPTGAASHDGVAIGDGASANTTAGNQSSPVAIGNGANATGAGSQVAIGDLANATGFDSIAIGGSAASNATKSNASYSVAIGVGSTATGVSSLALGGQGTTGAVATGQDSVALGNSSQSTFSETVAVGAFSVAGAANSSALGEYATAANAGDVAIGFNSITAATVNTIGATIAGVSYAFAGTAPASTASVGRPGAERTITNVAAGQITGTSTDAINGSELYATNSAVNLVSGQVVAQGNSTAADFGAGSTYNPTTGVVSAPSYTIAGATYGDVGSAFNALTGGSAAAGVKYFHANSTGTDSLATGPNAVAIGQSAVSAGTGSVAAGLGATASGLSGLAIGFGSTAGTSGVIGYATAIGGGVVGNNSDASIAIGRLAAVADNTVNSVAIGNNAQVSTGSTNAVAIGDASTALAANSVALGINSRAVNTNDVALGAGSTTAATVPTSSATINGTSYAFAGTAPSSTVSVGSAAAPRTITNVAAGQITAASTDAINGSELYATNSALGALASNAVLYNSAAKTGVTLGGAGATTPVSLTNVAAGSLTPTSTAAVNGSQINTLGTSVANNFGGGSTFNTTTGAVTAPSYTIAGTTYNNVGSALNAITGGSSTAGVKYFHANSEGTDSLALGVNSVAIGQNAVANNAGDVALGLGSTTAAAVSTAGATIAGTAYVFAGGTAASTVSVGASGADRTITNVAAGQITASSTDAINGSELYATDQAIANLSGVNSVLYDGAGKTSVTLGGVGSTTPVSLTNVAAGSLTPTSTAAVNGSQINTLGTSVANNFGGGSTFNTTTGAVTAPSYTIAGTTYNNVGSALNAITGGSSTAGVKYFHANSEGTDSLALGANSVAIGQNAVANGVGDVALGFNSVTSEAVATSSATIGGTSYLFAGASPTSTVSVGAPGAERTITNVAAGQITATSTDAINGSELYATDQAIATLSGVNSVLYDNAGKTSVTLGGAGSTTPVLLTNVAAGSLTSTSTDAVNGGQINTLGTSVANNFGGGSTFNPTTGTVTAPTYTVAGNTYNNVGSALNAITGGSSSAGVKYFHANSTGPDAVATGENAVAIGQSASAANAGDVALGSGSTTAAAIATAGATFLGVAYAFAGSAPTSTVSVGAPGAERTITNVAAGQITASSTDAVNGSELFAVTQAVATGSVGPVQYANAATPTTPNGGVPSQNLTLVGAAQAPVTLSNVAPGLLSATSTQAVNGAQLYATNEIANNSVQYDDPTHSSVTLGGTTSLTPVKLHNVAAGTATTDAVNLGQLNTGLNNAIGTAENYTDQQIALVNFNLAQLRRDAAAGAAGGLAAAGLPQAFSPGRSLVSAGVGAFAGEAAMAFGVSRVFDDGHTIIKAGVTYDSQGQVGGNAGIGYQW